MLNWKIATQSLDQNGFTILPCLLSNKECTDLALSYTEDHLFRSTINMKRYRFGEGEYRYFNYPLPKNVQSLRESLYPPLAQLANDWMDKLSIHESFPDEHSKMIEKCHQQNQLRPTPLLLKYETGGYNTLHQDLYGSVYFPFQVVIMLSEPGKDYEGGEFVLTEQLPRAQSRARVLQPEQGDALIITTNFRPVKGSRGYFRSKMKHGVSPLNSGTRYALGIIFHDAI